MCTPVRAVYWVLFSVTFFWGIRESGVLNGVVWLSRRIADSGKGIRELGAVRDLIQELRDVLQSGLQPGNWDRLESLAPPWCRVLSESQRRIREQGAPILPTLERMHDLVQSQISHWMDTRTRIAPIWVQSALGWLLVPVVGAFLFWMVPELKLEGVVWLKGVAAAWIWSGLGSLWILRLADRAASGGLTGEKRGWVLSALCSGEYFLAIYRSGAPPDLAWAQVYEFLRVTSPNLAVRWGGSLWKLSQEGPRRSLRLESRVEEFGSELKSALHFSIMEGRGCVDRVESLLLSFRSESRALIERETNLLGARVLKPLFICTAPSLLGLLAAGLAMGLVQ